MYYGAHAPSHAVDQFGGFRPGLAIGGRVNPEQTLAKINARLQGLYAKVAAGQGGPLIAKRIATLEQYKSQIAGRLGLSRGAQVALQGQPGTLVGTGIRGMGVVEHEFGPQVIQQHNVDQANQGLRWSVNTPPPSGNLTSIPFVTSGATNPVINLTAGAAGVIGATSNLVTEAVSWAILRITALTTQTLAAATGSTPVVQDLKVGGSANLLLSENWMDATQFDVDRDGFMGLRSNPMLRSPNVAQISVAARGGTAGAETVVAAFDLVVDVIRDDVFGPGLPGPGFY